jgi:hypothetical protein
MGMLKCLLLQQIEGLGGCVRMILIFVVDNFNFYFLHTNKMFIQNILREIILYV